MPTVQGTSGGEEGCEIKEAATLIHEHELLRQKLRKVPSDLAVSPHSEFGPDFKVNDHLER